MNAGAGTVRAFAPATVGNVAVGFDLLGHALVAAGDVVTVRRVDEPGVRIAAVEGLDLPLEPERNTAAAGLVRLARDRGLEFGLEVSVEKGIPLGSGMGGSAASAAAAVVAASALLPRPLTTSELLAYGMHGEAAATGAYHADNLAPALLGGLVLVLGGERPEPVRIPVPAGLLCVLVHPRLRLDTREARRVLPKEIALRDHVEQSGRLAAVLAGCYSGDLELIGRALADSVVEPHRATLVHGFPAVKQAALEAGALGCSLSGSGPSLFAWCASTGTAERVRAAMLSAFRDSGVEARGWISPVDAPGARLLAPGEDPHTLTGTSPARTIGSA